MNNVRGERALYGCFPCRDEEIVLINKENGCKYKVQRNAFGKIYWFDNEDNLCFLSEDKYNKYKVIS